MSDVIRLNGLRFHAIVGDLPHERTNPQPVEVDIEVESDLRAAAASDSLADGLDYRVLHAAVAQAVGGDRETAPHLLETLAERVAGGILAIERVERVRVRVRKPWAALPGPAEAVEVEIERP